MRRESVRPSGAVAIGILGLLLSYPVLASAQTTSPHASGPTATQNAAPAIDVVSHDIYGTVSGPQGPEAGVWVIAETGELQTNYTKIVVTDDRGRYDLPELPKANYKVWVRGYGLVDSPKVPAIPGTQLNLRAVTAPNPRAAAQYFPAGYWYSLIHVPAPSEFPGTGEAGNGINPNIKSQAQWIRLMKSGGCTACHQLGTRGTREIPAALGHFDSPVDAWKRRILSGQAGGDMSGTIAQLGERRAAEMFADWTTRIAQGEVPPTPPRPKGIERNVVITEWDWADPKAYLHDEVSTDRRNPTLNARGLIYGSTELSRDYLPVLDPTRNNASTVTLTVRDPATPPAAVQVVSNPSAYWGNEAIWTGKTNVHNPMFDAKGRVWITSTVRPRDNPDWCKKGSSQPSAQLFPLDASGTPARDVRPRHGQVDAHQHLLQHAPPDVRRRCKQHAVDERRWAGRRMAQHEEVSRDRRRAELAGMDRADSRHGWQRQA